jgi:hypothetical protein
MWCLERANCNVPGLQEQRCAIQKAGRHDAFQTAENPHRSDNGKQLRVVITRDVCNESRCQKVGNSMLLLSRDGADFEKI